MPPVNLNPHFAGQAAYAEIIRLADSLPDLSARLAHWALADTHTIRFSGFPFQTVQVMDGGIKVFSNEVSGAVVAASGEGSSSRLSVYTAFSAHGSDPGEGTFEAWLRAESGRRVALAAGEPRAADRERSMIALVRAHVAPLARAACESTAYTTVGVSSSCQPWTARLVRTTAYRKGLYPRHTYQLDVSHMPVLDQSYGEEIWGLDTDAAHTVVCRQQTHPHASSGRAPARLWPVSAAEFTGVMDAAATSFRSLASRS